MAYSEQYTIDLNEKLCVLLSRRIVIQCSAFSLWVMEAIIDVEALINTTLHWNTCCLSLLLLQVKALIRTMGADSIE